MWLARKRLALIAGLALAGLALGAWAGIGLPDPAQGGTSDGSGALGITVSGTGSVKAAPDQAEFSFGVETQGATPQEALAKNNAAVQKVIDAIKAAGVAASDIQTQQVSVSPRYSEDGQTIIGYSAVNSVTVKVRDLSKAGAIVDAAVKAGANQVYGPTFSIADQGELYRDALGKAFDDAQVKAAAVAAAAGVSLGAVVNVVESGGLVPPVPAGAAEAAPGEVPIEPGLQEIQATLTVTFAIA